MSARRTHTTTDRWMSLHHPCHRSLSQDNTLNMEVYKKYLVLSTLLLVLIQGANVEKAENANQGLDALVNPHKITVHGTVINNEADSFIFGGNEVAPNSEPHQAFLTTDTRAYCGGSLISSNWVLTSARCIYGSRTVNVTLGAHDINLNETTTQIFSSTDIRQHPDFSLEEPTRDDVALIKLPNPATLNSYVSTVCLVSSTTGIKDGTLMTATGFGLLSNVNNIYSTLQMVTMASISNQECAKTYSTIFDSNICTKPNGTQGVCTGDYGGPLTFINTYSTNESYSVKAKCQAGVTSFSSTVKCETIHPSGFTRISYVVDWITQQTGVQPCKECSTASCSINYPYSFLILLSSIFVLKFKAAFQ